MGVKGKYFMIVSPVTGLVLDVTASGESPGTEVIMWERTGNDNQLWYEHPVSGTVCSKHNNLCLDFSGSNRLIVNTLQPGTANQRWHYNKQRKTIDNDANPNKVFDIIEGKKEPGTAVCAWDYHGGDNQHWKIEPVTKTRYFFIKSAMHGKVLDIEGASKDLGVKVVMYDQKDASSADNQLWFEDRYGNIRSKLNDRLILDANGDCVQTNEFQIGNRRHFWCIYGNLIVNRFDINEVLDIKERNADNCAELCAWANQGSDNQHWHFEYV